MSFANLSPLMFAAGLIGLAVLLYVLQRLRVRYREIAVVTTLFWREATKDAPVRVFRQRFRHFLSYLLILAICSLIWIAIAEPRLDADADDERYVFLLDGSAGMARTTGVGSGAESRFEAAVERLISDVKGMPADNRRVMTIGATVRTLLAPGEHCLLLEKRLKGLEPDAAPSLMEQQLRHLANVEGDGATVLIYGDARIGQDVLDELPPSFIVKRVTDSGLPTSNAGITALGANEASSGAWDKVDVLVRSEREDGVDTARDDLRISIDGVALQGNESVETADGSFIFRDIPARGGLFEVGLVGDDVLSLDNTARLRLPERPLIRVRLSPTLEPYLGVLLAADPAVVLTDQDPDIVVRLRGEDLGAAKAVLEFVPMAVQDAAFLLRYPGDEDNQAILARAIDGLGLNQIDATALAEATENPIAVSIEAGETSAFLVWEELLGPEHNFTQSRSFPLFIAKSLRWLAGEKAWYAYAAAGEPLTTEADARVYEFVDRKGNVLATLGTPFVPDQAGPLLAGNPAGSSVHVSLLDRQLVSAGRTEEIEGDGDQSLSRLSAPDLVTWLSALALLLLVVEWYFFQKGLAP